MLSEIEKEKLFNIGKGMSEEELHYFLMGVSGKYMVEELNRRNKLVADQYNGLVNKIQEVKDDTPYDQLAMILKECKDILKAGIFDEQRPVE